MKPSFNLYEHIKQSHYNWSDFDSYIYDLELANDNSNVVNLEA